MNFGMLIIMLLTSVVRGPGSGEESAFGLGICDSESWLSLSLMIIVSITMTAVAIRLAGKEYAEKRDNGYKFIKGDQELKLSSSLKLSSWAFIGSFLCSVTGVGPGMFFVPLFV